MAKKIEAKRTRMTDAEVQNYLKHYSKKHDLKGKELEHAVHRCAATRWAALERNAAKASKPKAKSKARKPAKAKAVHKKAA